MAPRYHPTPLSGGDRKALAKELSKSRAMTTVLARSSKSAGQKARRRSARPTSCSASLGTRRSGPTEARSIRPPRSTKPWIVATHASRSNARAARLDGTSTWRRCAIRQPLPYTT